MCKSSTDTSTFNCKCDKELVTTNTNKILIPPSRKVFIPNLGTHDYSKAEKHGVLYFVTKGEQPKYATDMMARNWAKALADSTPNDFIMVTSLTVLVGIGMYMFGLKHKRLNILLFRNNEYIARTILGEQLLLETISDVVMFSG